MPLRISNVVGLLALFIFGYRFVFLLIPMFLSGIREKKYTMMFDSLTLLI